MSNCKARWKIAPRCAPRNREGRFQRAVAFAHALPFHCHLSTVPFFLPTDDSSHRQPHAGVAASSKPRVSERCAGMSACDMPSVTRQAVGEQAEVTTANTSVRKAWWAPRSWWGEESLDWDVTLLSGWNSALHCLPGAGCSPGSFLLCYPTWDHGVNHHFPHLLFALRVQRCRDLCKEWTGKGTPSLSTGCDVSSATSQLPTLDSVSFQAAVCADHHSQRSVLAPLLIPFLASLPSLAHVLSVCMRTHVWASMWLP